MLSVVVVGVVVVVVAVVAVSVGATCVLCCIRDRSRIIRSVSSIMCMRTMCRSRYIISRNISMLRVRSRATMRSRRVRRSSRIIISRVWSH